jgi:hypothetical protein
MGIRRIRLFQSYVIVGTPLPQRHTLQCPTPSARRLWKQLPSVLFVGRSQTPENTSSPNVSQRGRVAAESSSSRRRRQVKIRKSSCGPSSAVLLAVLVPGVRIFGQGKTHHFPRLVVQRNWSRYLLPLSSAELQLATAGAPGEIFPDKDSLSTAKPRFCVP